MEAVLDEAFAPFGFPKGSALRRVLVSALEFGRIVPLHDGAPGEGEVILDTVIDRQALFKAIVADGLRVGQRGSSSTWLVDWLADARVDPQQLLSLDFDGREDQRYSPWEGRIVASQSLISMILPAAAELANATTGKVDLHLRHVQFALLRDVPLEWFGPSFTSDQLQRLRLEFAERNAGVDADNPDAWEAATRDSAGPAPAQSSDEPAESVPTLSDGPATVDSLGRQAFAEVLAARIRDVGATLRASGVGSADSTFILHMDGPWGSGKSSVLNFLKADLESPGAPWLVVSFNAWRNQSRKPPWWPLISTVGAAAAADRKWFHLTRSWWVWSSWRWRMRWLPKLLAGFLVVALVLFAFRVSADSEAGLFGIPKAIADAVGGLLALIAVGGLGLTTGHKLFWGAGDTVDSYIQSSSEPFERVIRLFQRLVRAVGRPVAVFIDDLDRCDSDYVIDLLEGIQTLLRSAPVVYVIAGDRKWISSSFEKRYVDFRGEIGTPGRPLGYLFLDKVFQLSTTVPQLSGQRQSQYWRLLLDRGGPHSTHAGKEARKRLADESARELSGKTRHEDIQREIDKTEEGTLEREAILAAAAKQITSPEAILAAEHRLQPLAQLLEANPRSMKRLVNAYGLNQARAFLEGRDVSVEALARWTIIELRWPVLADYLARNWPDIADGTLSPSNFPDPIRELLIDAEVRAVVGSAGEKGHLDVESLTPILD